MSDTPENPNNNAAPGAQATMMVHAQYLKDLSFESPRAPLVFQAGKAPEIDVNIDVQGRAVGEHQYEVELSVACKAQHDEEPAFVVEAAYAGVFEIKGVPQEQLEMIMLVECPRLLFPFLRQVIADATRNGNFPPVMLEPIDFLTIYMTNRERAAAAAGNS